MDNAYHPCDLPFGRESPYFSSEVDRHRLQLRSADEHLGSVTSCTAELITAMQAVGSASRNLALVLTKTPAIFHAASVVGALGSILSELSSAEDVLAESLELSFYKPLLRFRRDLSRLDEMRRASDRADAEARAAIEMLLHGDWAKVERDVKKKLRRQQGTSPSKYASPPPSFDEALSSSDSTKSTETMWHAIDDIARLAAEKRRSAELRRFDLARFVSSLQRRKGLVLAEASVAALCSLRAFYAQASHAIGDAAAAAHAQQTEIAAACEREKGPWDLRMLKLQAILNERELRRHQHRDDKEAPPASRPPDDDLNLAEEVANAEARHGVYTIDDQLQQLYDQALLPNNTLLEGFLFAQHASTRAKNRWTRRWFTLDHESLRVKREPPSWSGQLLRGVLAREPSEQPNEVPDAIISEDEDDDEVAQLLLSTVKDCRDERCAFEIHSAHGAPRRLQASGEKQAARWRNALREVIAAQLSRDSLTIVDSPKKSDPEDNAEDNTLETVPSAGELLRGWTASPPPTLSQDAARRECLAAIEEANAVCCDCGSPQPEWCVINVGVLVCLGCSGVHRSLGTHVSKVRSLRLDRCSALELVVTKRIGNHAANQIFEASLPPSKKPTHEADAKSLADFIRAKWRDKAFLAPNAVPNPTQALLKACTEGDIHLALAAIAHGADPSEPLFLCQAAQFACAPIAQLLVFNGAHPANPHPLTKRTPLDYLLNESSAKSMDLELRSLLMPAY